MKQVIAVCALVCAAGSAHAQPRGLQGRASVEVDADLLAPTKDLDGNDRDYASSFGVAVRALVGKKHIFYGAGFGYRLGATPGGFLYRAELFPIGIGTGISDLVHVGVYAGAGFSGVTSQLPLASIFPVEARLDLRLGKRIAIGGFARAVWTTNDRRNRGAPSSDRVDELAAGARLRWSRYYDLNRRAFGTDGYYVAALVDESLGVRFVGAAFGYSLDAGLE